MRSLSRQEARRFLLAKHGLLGERIFAGKEGVLAFIRQAGCIQFDPIDVCGKNAELVLQSRVAGFNKAMLSELLYTDRELIDCFDKNLSILPTADYPYFAASREASRERGRSRVEVDGVCGDVLEFIRKNGPVCSADLRAAGIRRKVDWYWTSTSLSRAVLETLYFRGALAVSRKKGTVKYYDLAENCLPPEILAAADPLGDRDEHRAWRMLRRIGSVGLLWNKPSDAWLNIPSCKTAERQAAFEKLLAAGRIVPVAVAEVGTLYALSSDIHLLDSLAVNGAPGRCELVAPLDNLLWDRKLLHALWDFDYTWEIYTPAARRRYGYYVLPLLYGERFVGRLEPVVDKKALRFGVKNIWYEPWFCPDADFKRSLANCLERFSVFNGCTAP